jgi:restriction endonuclease NotI
MPKNPLAEVFGFPASNMSQDAVNHREGRLCPYHNPSGLNCTKTSATDPLGVCSIFDNNKIIVTCPVRLRQDLSVLADAAHFFFPNKRYVALTEARLKDKHGKSAGNIDIVLAALDEHNKVVDFGAIEVQAVYISGNVRKVFNEYMKDPAANHAMEWPSKNYPSPDYLSSSRKRLVPQLMFKGGILHEWGKKMAVVVHRGFFDQLPPLREVSERNADLAWFIYDLRYNSTANRYNLRHSRTKYTTFENVLSAIATPTVGNANKFVEYLEGRIRKGKFSVAPTPSSLEPTVEPLPGSLEDEE